MKYLAVCTFLVVLQHAAAVYAAGRGKPVAYYHAPPNPASPAMSEQMQEMRLQMAQMEKVVAAQGALIESLQQGLGVVEEKIIEEVDSETELEAKDDERHEHIRYIYQGFGCPAQEITLQCPNGRTVEVTDAVYGSYSPECSECCFPREYSDCSESIFLANLEEWVRLKLRCNNTTICHYTYPGVAIFGCGEVKVADYMKIIFRCLPENAEDPVGFTAYASSTQSYSVGDALMFDEIAYSFGGFYNHSSGAFLCPYDGMYQFSVSISAVVSQKQWAELMRNDTAVVSFYADYDTQGNSHAGGSAVMWCPSGQEVWLRAAVNGQMFGGGRASHFSGNLLFKY